MKILYFGSYDPAAQMYLTAKAMRDHLGWEAHSLMTQQTWLNYDYDWWLGNNVELSEVIEFARSCDYLIMADIYGQAPLLGDIYELCTPKNSCVAALGTPFRKNMPTILYNQIHSGTVALVPPMEVTMIPNVISVPMDHLIVDVETIRKLTQLLPSCRKGPVSICHATVDDNRGRLLYEKVISRLQSDGHDIKWDVIRGVPWAETIVRKNQSHITLDSIHIPIPGLNCMEGLLLGHEVVSAVDPWCYMINPDLPIRSFHPASTGKSLEDGLYDALCEVIFRVRAKIDGEESGRGMVEYDGNWVLNHNSPGIVASRWLYFMNWALRRGK